MFFSPLSPLYSAPRARVCVLSLLESDPLPSWPPSLFFLCGRGLPFPPPPPQLGAKDSSREGRRDTERGKIRTLIPSSLGFERGFQTYRDPGTSRCPRTAGGTFEVPEDGAPSPRRAPERKGRRGTPGRSKARVEASRSGRARSARASVLKAHAGRLPDRRLERTGPSALPSARFPWRLRPPCAGVRREGCPVHDI